MLVMDIISKIFDNFKPSIRVIHEKRFIIYRIPLPPIKCSPLEALLKNLDLSNFNIR